MKKGAPSASHNETMPVGSAGEMLTRNFGGSRILVVEDEPFNREIAQMLLEDVGLAVESVEDGEKAVAMAAQHRYALILMDMQMPRMDGLEATRLIRGLADSRDIPILAMTANAFSEDRQRCLDAGMSDFLTKPVKPEELYSSLFKWLSRGKAA